MERERFYREVTDFLHEQRVGGDEPTVATTVGEDANLFDLGLVDSFTIIRMLVFIEELTGVQIDLADHELETFYTLRGLYAVVAGEAR